MTGVWEQRLINLAEGGVPWDMPYRSDFLNGLNALKQVLDQVKDDPGLAGKSGDAAKRAFAYTAGEVQKQINYLGVHMPIPISQANEVRTEARDAAATLPPGQMSPGQDAAVRGAAVGATLMLGPVAFLAGEGASRAINTYMAEQREAEAKRHVETYSGRLDALNIDQPPSFDGRVSDEDETPPENPEQQTGGPGGARGRSFEQYPDWDIAPGGSGPTTGGGDPSAPPPEAGAVPPGPGEHGPFPGGVPGLPPGSPAPIDIGNIPPEPTPDGPISGSPTLPGGIPMVPGGGGGGLVGTPGSPGAGLGSGLGAGLIAGGGGAIALGRVGGGAGAPGVPGGRLFGGPAGGSVGAGGAGGARSGGLLGRPGAGAGLGTRGVGGLGAAGTGSANSTARGAGARAGGLGAAGTRAGGVGGAGGSTTGASGGRAGAASGRTGAGSAGGSGAAGTGRTAGAGSRGVGGMGGPGSRSERKKDEARGLAGPIAPRMEDDEQMGPRSENAQAGGRDE